MATKKTSKKRVKTHLDIGSDPPVLVGGGSSSYIWTNLGQAPTQVPPDSVPPGAPSPHTRNSYSCSKITNSPVRLYFNNGVTPGPAGEVPLEIPAGSPRGQWYIRFARPGEKSLRRKKAKKK